ncbi:DUF2127 domain-containing protein [Polaromonas sp. P2-4]|nr:DUF2127 domain-containing protein [Polaromonas sp. P2-4]
MRLPDGVRAVAALEAAKGILVLLAGFGLLSLIHHNAQQLAAQVLGHLHLNPANRYPRIFIDAAAADRTSFKAIGHRRSNICAGQVCRSLWLMAQQALGGVVCGDQRGDLHTV